MPPSVDYDFRVISYPYRVYSGKNALDHLAAEVKRHGAQRPFVICGRSVSQRTDLVQRLRSLLGTSLAGVFDAVAAHTHGAEAVKHAVACGMDCRAAC